MHRFLHRTLGLAGNGQVGNDVCRFADAGRLAATAADDTRAFLDQRPHGREPDAVGRPGDEAGTVAKAEIHGSLAYPP
jgi:hypothetical protein